MFRKILQPFVDHWTVSNNKPRIAVIPNTSNGATAALAWVRRWDGAAVAKQNEEKEDETVSSIGKQPTRTPLRERQSETNSDCWKYLVYYY